MGKRKLSAQLTIMAVLVFALVISLMVVLIESAVSAGAKTKIGSAVNLGVQSLFSQYSRPLLDEYEVFGGVIHKEDEIIKNLHENISKNCSQESTSLWGVVRAFDPYAIKVLGINISEKKMLTDEEGTLFYGEIVDYMGYGMFEDDILESIPKMLETAQNESVEAVNDELEKRQKEAWKIDAKVLELLMYVEGIKTNSSGFVQSFGKLSSKSDFVKKICPNGTGFGDTGVDNSQVYEAVSGKYYDITKELNDLKGDLDLIVAVYNSPLTKGLFIDMGFRANAQAVLDEVGDTFNYIEKALGKIEEIESSVNQLAQNLAKSRQVLDANKSNLDSKVAEAFELEFQELDRYSRGEISTLCDVSEVKRQLQEGQAILYEMNLSIGSMAHCQMDINSISQVYGMIDSCIQVCKKYNGSAIKFNYEGITLGKGKSISVLEDIKDVFTNNTYKLVIEDESKISNKKISYKDLSSAKCLVESGGFEINLQPQALYEDFLYNRYVSIHFGNFLNTKEGGLLDYEMEYILGEKNSDKENLKETINQLVTMRYLLNFTYIMCDAEKKKQCHDMALTLLGFTGSYGVIKLGEFLLLSAWAHAESINDVKNLINGGKVPVVKDAKSWKTTLENIMNKQIGSSEDSNSEGFEYDQYLQLLLFLKNKSQKIYRTMDMMEVNMINRGYSHVRMYNYLYSLKGSVQFKYKNDKYNYLQNFEFSY